MCPTARSGPVFPGLGGSVARTALCNIVAALAAGGSGVVVARALGPSPRGEYAAITVWLVVGFTVGDLGLNAATTFHTARHPRRRPGCLATSRLLTAVSGFVMMSLGLLLAPVLARHDPGTVIGYRITSVTCLVMVLGFSCTAALQATDLRRWNVVRTSQPVIYLLAVTALWVTGHLGLVTTLLALLVTTVVQSALAYGWCRAAGLTGGRADAGLAGPLAKFGAGELAITVPALATTRVDQIALAGAGNAAGLGHYAVASSLTGLAVPVASALGYVAFPRLAAADLTWTGAERLRRRSLLAGAGMGVVVTGGLAASAPWLVPAVFGAGFRDSVTLIWLLAPTGVLAPATKVCADLIRGHGRPLVVAGVQATSAVVMTALLFGLVPASGGHGAAVAASTTAVISFVLMVSMLRRTAHRAETASVCDGSPV